MSGRFACMGLLGMVVALVAASSALGVSSISVAVDPPVVSARIAVVVTMASDDAGIKRAYAQGRIDDGRPCEPTLAAFTAATTASQARGIIESIPFVAGTTTVTVARAFQPGAVRVCGYLVGPSASALAMSDGVVVFRLPTAALSMTFNPDRPAFNQSLSVRVTGTSEIDLSVEVYPGAGNCSRETEGGDRVTSITASPSQGPVAVTLPDVSHPEATDRICLVAHSGSQIAAPNEAHLPASFERPFSQDLGGSIRLISATLYWRRVELVGEVTGVMPDSAFEARVQTMGGDLFSKLPGSDRYDHQCRFRGHFIRRRGNQVVFSQKLEICSHAPKAVLAGLTVTTAFGARLTTSLAPLDLSDTIRRTGLLVTDRSISGVTLGMTYADLVRANGGSLRADRLGLLNRAGIAPGYGRARNIRGYEFDGVNVAVRGGRVVAMAATDFELNPNQSIPLRTSAGMRPAYRGRVARWKKTHPEARCVQPTALVVSACRLGRFTYIKPRPLVYPGFFAILPGRRPTGELKGAYVPLR